MRNTTLLLGCGAGVFVLVGLGLLLMVGFGVLAGSAASTARADSPEANAETAVRAVCTGLIVSASCNTQVDQTQEAPGPEAESEDGLPPLWVQMVTVLVLVLLGMLGIGGLYFVTTPAPDRTR